MNSVLKTLLILIAVLLALNACLPAIENQLVFWPLYDESETPADYGLEFEVLELASEDGTRLHAWAIPYKEDAPWLIYFHGNTSNMTKNLPTPLLIRERAGMNLLMAGYRGYYQSEGKPGEAGLYQDAQAYYNYLLSQDITPDEIVLWGFSLGSGVAAELASKQEVAALILQAPYTSVPDAARWRYNTALPDSLFQNHFRTKDKIGDINAPLLIVHGENDDTIPFEHSLSLIELASEPKRLISFQGNHDSLKRRAEEDLSFVIDGIISFLQGVLSQ